MREIFLIGGAPGSGKSTIAKQLAERLQLPWISTDQVRRILRPETDDESKKIELVWNGTCSFLQGIHPWDGGIIEGTAILPEYVQRDVRDISNVRVVFLIQTEEQIASIVEERSFLPYIHTKTPEQKAQRIRQISDQNASIKQKAKEYGYLCVQARDENTLTYI